MTPGVVGSAKRMALLERAEAARASGANDEARDCCMRVLREFPADPQALNLMTELAADSRDSAEGRIWAERAIAADADSARPHYALGRMLEYEGRLAEAEASYRAALRRAPDHARAHNNLGCVLHMQGRLAEALASYRKALELDPALPEALQNCAAITRDPAALEQAIEAYRLQAKANPGDAELYCNLANACRELGRHDEALAGFERAIQLRPDLAEAHFSRSFVLLLQGRYPEGWKEYEWRWRLPVFDAPARRFPQPMWDGARRAGATILLHAEQGLGDTLQFVRYAPLVAERCGSVILECQPELKSLLAALEGVAAVVAQGEPLPAFDTHLPLMSLPHVFGTTLDSVPWKGPYLHADPRRVAAWQTLTDGRDSRLRVGLAWAGRPQQWDDRKRSLSLEMLSPLAEIAGARFYSLQKGEAAAQAIAPPRGMQLVDLTARIEDFADTAALARQLDLIVSVDTSVAHLCGAMDLPTLVLVAYAPDWRYHLQRPDNPWYPAMRLFRQPRDGDWHGAIVALARELARRAASG